MALSTYTELQSEIADWLDRADLTAKIPTFIRLLEAQLQRKLRVREMLITAPGTVDSTGFSALPDDFLALHNLTLTDATGRPTPLTYASKHQLDTARFEKNGTGQPRLYTLNRTHIEFAPYPDADYAYSLSYWSKLSYLSSGVPTNWVLEAHPDIYLYGSLLQAAPYLRNDERISVWGDALGTLLEDINLADERSLRGGTPLKMRMKAYG
jgi:hypothetical protein